jgi:hypothetical protein
MGRQGGKIVKTYTYKKYIKKSMLYMYSVYSVCVCVCVWCVCVCVCVCVC